MRSSIPKLFHPLFLIIILMLRGASCSAQYQFQVICQKDDGQQGTVIDGKHYVGNSNIAGLSDSGEPLFGASTQENPTVGDIPSTLFLGSKAINSNGVVIDGWAIGGSGYGGGYGGSMTSDGTVTFDAGLDTSKISAQQQKTFMEKYLLNYGDYCKVQVAAGASIPHFIALHHADPLHPENDNPKNQQMGCSFYIIGSKLGFVLEPKGNGYPSSPTDPALKEQLKIPVLVDWSKLLGGKVTAASSSDDYSGHTCIINKRGQILFAINFTRGDPNDSSSFWKNSAIILGTPTNAPAPEVALMGTDANHDGTITFNDADKSTAAHPYTFWLNNNRDVFMPDEKADEDQDPALAKIVDSSLPKIPDARDLEDFARLQIKLPSDFNADSGQWKVTLELAPLSPASGTPAINVVPAPTTGMDYLTGSDDQLTGSDNQEIAHLLSSSKVKITESMGAVAHGVKGTILDLKTLHIQEGIIPLLFEGKTAGKGVLTVHVYKFGTEVAKDKTYLNLLPITKMYDHYTADPLENGLPWQDGGTTGDGGASNQVTLKEISTEPKQVNQDETTHPTLDYVLFVHGWRMPRWERIAFAQTAFKRLWHLGYQGRFGFFSWPTEYTTTDIPTMVINHTNYDNSEWKAYTSAQALHSLLTTLNQKYTVRVFAHSMGNVVTSEALRLESEAQSPRKLVQTYVASQAAVAAQAYDVNAATVTSHDPAPNIYAFYPAGNSSHGTPYFGSISKAAGNLVNFFNPDDYALKNWRLDQTTKPDRGYTYVLNGLAQPYPNDHLPDGFYRGETPLVMPQNAYEIFAKAAPAYSLALGAQTGVGGPFSKQVDLKQACSFTDKANNHSAQFEDTFSKRQSYWKLLLKAFQLGEPVPN